jgi:putative lipoic acid-binding regulatory protein
MDAVEFLKLHEKIESLEVTIMGLQDIFKERRIDTKDRSECLGDLLGALAKAQSEMKIAGKDSNNPFFKSKYADLASVVAASRPALTKNELAVIQRIAVGADGKRFLVTMLGHSSGQYITSTVLINPAKDDVQSLGSAITYLRRYTYASIVGVVADDEDDDAEIAMKPVRNGYHAPQARIAATEPIHRRITTEQLKILKRTIDPVAGLEDSIMSMMER